MKKKKAKEIIQKYRDKIKKVNEYNKNNYIRKTILIRKSDIEDYLKDKNLENNPENREKATIYLAIQKLQEKLENM